MTINAPNISFSIAVADDGTGKRYSRYADGVTPVSPGYLEGPALYTLSGNEQAHGTVYTGSAGSRTTYDNTRGYGGNTQSMKLQVSQGHPPATCGGSVYFGGRFNLPVAIPSGYDIWMRALFYLPTSLPMGYVFGSSDSTDAATCGQPHDGSGSIKWLVLSHDPNDTARLYLNIRNSRRTSALRDGAILTSESESGATTETTIVVPRDAWFDVQLHARLRTAAEGGGFLRGWVNNNYVGQLNKGTLGSAGNPVRKWGIGNYWNGVPWTDGDPGSTDSFWMAELIIATDYPGYGAPTSTDSGGRPYIDPSISVSDL